MAKIINTRFKTWSAHWRNTNLINAKLAINAFNFLVLGTEFAENFFKQSFDKERFLKSGQRKWQKRSDNGKLTHPILNETGELKNSIRKTRPSNNGTFLGASVRTNEKFGNRSGKKNPSYASVHNERWQDTGLWSNQHRKTRPIQRQFMGHNEYLYAQIAKRYLKKLREGIL